MKGRYAFQLLQSEANSEYFWRLVAGNGQTVASSGETYANMGGCLGGLYLFRENSQNAEINDRTQEDAPGRVSVYEFELFEDASGEYRWRFQAGNNQIVAVSGEGYTTKASALKAAGRINSRAGEAEVVVDIDEPVDVEECALAAHPVPRAKRYRIRIDRQRHTTDRPSLSGRDLLNLAGKSPVERFRIDQKLRTGQVKRIRLDDSVAICAPGVERFMTLPLDQKEG